MPDGKGGLPRPLAGNHRLAEEANPSCSLCRKLRIHPFRRCRDCTLQGAGRCPTVKAGFFLVLAVVATGLTAKVVGGETARTVFIMTSLVAAALLLLVNSHSDEQARTRVELHALHRELSEQHEFLKELSPLESLQQCVEYIVGKTAGRLRCGRVSIMLAEEGGEYLRIAAAVGVPQDVIAQTRLPIGQRVSGRVFQSDSPIHVHDAKAAPPAQPSASLPIDSPAFMAGPLLLSGMCWGAARLGVLSVTEPIGREDFSLDDEFIFSNICEAAAVAIYNHQAVAKVKQANVELLETLVNAIEARDRYTRGHSERVSKFAAAIGRRLLLSEESIAQLQIAGRLHDVGKIGIPDEILRKRAALSPPQRQAVQSHTEIAARILAHASVVSAAIDAIRHHHERLDGSGYPNGLAGQQIPLLARIVGVADAFDAMTTVRPYHDPLPAEEAMAELGRCGARQFDPACVAALGEAVRAGQIAALATDEDARQQASDSLPATA